MEAQVSSKSAREAMIAKISLIIPNIPQDIIGSVLDSNKGDVNRTVMALLAVAKAMSSEEEDDDDEPESKLDTPGWDGKDERGQLASVIQLYGGQNSTCGYCHSNAATSVTFGMNGERLTAQDYQALIDRGWRRAGRYCYKPDNMKTCCPLYTIRLNVHEFKPSKHHRAVWNRFKRYLQGAYVPAPKVKSGGAAPMDTAEMKAGKAASAATPHAAIIVPLAHAVQAACSSWITSAHPKLAAAELIRACGPVRITFRAAKGAVAGELASNFIFVFMAQLKKHGVQGQTAPALAAEIAQLILASPQLPYTVAADNGFLNFRPRAAASDAGSSMETAAAAPADAPKRPAKIAHKPASQRAASEVKTVEQKDSVITTVKSATDVEYKGKAHTLTVTSVPAELDREAFALYQRYQVGIHKDEPNKATTSGYTRFLCSPPFPPADRGMPYGGFHQHYRLDGKLIAVGVCDILPACLSSVYLFYDPDVAFLSPGVLTALVEIDCVKRLSVSHPALHYYYMGYYIHSCPKMRYKAQFQPSDLACPERYTWHRFSAVKPMLELLPYVILSAYAPPVPSDTAAESKQQAVQTSTAASKASVGKPAAGAGLAVSAAASPAAAPVSVDPKKLRKDQMLTDGAKLRRDLAAALKLSSAKIYARSMKKVTSFGALSSHAKTQVMKILSSYAPLVGQDLLDRLVVLF